MTHIRLIVLFALGALFGYAMARQNRHAQSEMTPEQVAEYRKLKHKQEIRSQFLKESGERIHNYRLDRLSVEGANNAKY